MAIWSKEAFQSEWSQTQFFFRASSHAAFFLAETAPAGKSYTGEGSASFEKLENLFGDQREAEDSFTSLEVWYLL